MSRDRSRWRLAVLFLGAGCSDAPPGAPTVRYDDSRGFTDAFAASGIRLEEGRPWELRVGPINAAALADCDRDGLPDAFVFSWNGAGTLWRNLGGFRFEAIDPPPGLAGSAPSAAAFGDLDNDGLPDLVVATGVEDFLRNARDEHLPIAQEVRVFRNLGRCRFEDVSAAWGFGAWPATASSLIAGFDLADVNLDGRLDLLGRRILDPDAAMRLYLSRPDGTWAEAMTEALGPMAGSNWSNFFTDHDDDGLADLFILFDERVGPPARSLRRTSASAALPYLEETFDPRIFAPMYNTASLMGAAAGDVDGDGRLDLYLTDVGPQHLYTHRGGRRDVAAEAGVDIPELPSEAPTVAYAASLADYDNDTWPDLAVACSVDDGFFAPPVAFLRHNRGDGTFADASPLLHQGPTFASQWMTASDLDRDGRIDYWMGGASGPPRLLRNEVVGGRSFAVRLHGRTTNAEGVGSKVTVRVGSRTLVQEMQGGGAPWGYGEPRLVFGLGGATRADLVEVRWTDGYVQRAGPFAAGSEAVVEEPAWLQVEPRTVAVGGEVRVTVRPARADGGLLGAGHRVGVTLDPGEVALVVSDDGGGAYTATARGLAAGLHGFTVSVDGVTLFAHPQVSAR